MIWAGSGWWILVGICALIPPPTLQVGLGEATTPKTGMEPLESPPTQDEEQEFQGEREFQGCGVTFHTSDPCGIPGIPLASRQEWEQLRELLEDTKATLRSLEVPGSNGSRVQDIVSEAIPAIHEANLEFRESLENVRRELEAHVARVEQPQLLQRKEELRKGVRLLSHVLLLTGRLAQGLESTSQQIQDQLSRSLQSVAAP